MNEKVAFLMYKFSSNVVFLFLLFTRASEKTFQASVCTFSHYTTDSLGIMSIGKIMGRLDKKDLTVCQRRKTPDEFRRLRATFLLCSYFWTLAFSEIAIGPSDRYFLVFYTIAEVNLRDC